MNLIVQPRDGLTPVLDAIRAAESSIEIMIFRFDRGDIARELEAAVSRGVVVRALIAHTNRGGEKSLRKLELRLLAGGVTVSRTADDLVRYHAKYLIVDRRTLLLLGFNYTAIDIRHSRSFGLVTGDRGLVADVRALFEADAARQPFVPEDGDIVVSPQNARERLATFLSEATRSLLIYDPKLSDPAILRILQERRRHGVDVRVLGGVGRSSCGLPVFRPTGRLHVRAIIRDGAQAFIGSQSLRRLELERRRELGAIVRDAAVVREMTAVFEEDWLAAQKVGKGTAEALALTEQDEALAQGA